MSEYGMRCYGEGEITYNPGYPDAQTETSGKCPGCVDCQPDESYDNGFYSSPRRCEFCGFTTTSRDEFWGHVVQAHE